MWRSVLALLVAVLIPELVGALGAVATVSGVSTWYVEIAKPSFTPPSWVFGPVWVTLYLMMGVASWLVWRRGWKEPAVRSALLLYGVHLAFNGAWSVLFFGLRRPGLAFAEILVLLALAVWTALRFRKLSRPAWRLMVPYLAWVAFASLLNGAIWWLNRG